MDALEAIQAKIQAVRPDLLPLVAPLIEAVRLDYGGDTDYIKKSKALRKVTLKKLAKTSRETARRNQVTRRTAQRWGKRP
jgi:hypothetical protein